MQESFLIKGIPVFLQKEPMPGWVFVNNGIIHRIGVGDQLPTFDQGKSPAVIDAYEHWILPGFIDTHVHGAAGVDVMDASVEGMLEMARFFASHGVTGFLPTTWAAPYEQIHQTLVAVDRAMNVQHNGARILGVHLEGPYLNKDYCGAQNPDNIYLPDVEKVKKLLNGGLIRILTLAPEIPGADLIIEECKKFGVIPSAGHSGASVEEMMTAVQKGLRHVTHCFNGMSPFHHRQPGMVGASLLLDELVCEVIVDNIHLHPAAVQLLARIKGPERLILVTDAICGTGLADGIYSVLGKELEIKNEAARLSNGALAGSTLTMERALMNLLATLKEPLERWVQAATLNPAKLLNLDHRIGDLVEGKDADLVILSRQGEVCMTMVQGRIVFSVDGFGC